MVWKSNFLVDGMPTTIEGFLDEYFPLCYFKNLKDIFYSNLYVGRKNIPKHFVFANFQCLRCALCCKNYDAVQVFPEQIKKWESEGRDDILKYIWALPRKNGTIFVAEICSHDLGGCPLCRKVRGTPYYYCGIRSAKKNLPACKVYLCSKSLPVAHLNYEDVEELIKIIGLESYYALIERDWGEQFDYSACELKTH